MDVNQEKEMLDSLVFFHQERQSAEALYVLNPRDADNLIEWAGALFQLSYFQTNTDSIKMKEDAISKLEEALSLNPENHYALWCMGTVYNSLTRLYPVEGDTFTMSFNKAYALFKKALDKDPQNEVYLKSKQEFEQKSGQNFKAMKDNHKAPEPHMKTHKNGLGKQLVVGESSGSSNPKAAKKPKSSNLMYDTLGWVILAVDICTWIWIAKSRVPPPPPR